MYFSSLKVIGILATALIVCLFAVPNFFSPETVKNWPMWAQRHLVLGLDLQGGSHILLQVDAADVKRQKMDTLRDDVRRVLRDAKVGYTGLAIRGDSVEVRIRDDQDFNLALTKLRELSVPLSGLLGGTGQRSVDVSDAGNRLIRLTVTEAAMTERIRQVVEQAVPIIEKRVNALGLVEPTIQRQGVDRVLVQVPGLDDPQRLLKIIGETAKLEFRMVDLSMSAEDALKDRPPADSEVLYETRNGVKSPVLVQKQVLVSGEDLIDAQPGFDGQTSEPVVNFRFNTSGARKFATITQENVGRPFAIVLDNEVITAPVIRTPIIGGSGQISGQFTVESANNLAILLRAGALPAKLTPIEQRVVGAGLGQDQIDKGKLACYVGVALVVIFMFATYGLFGLFANLAVAINVAMIFGILSLLNATLTLPGIAGIVLTVGIAVDSNITTFIAAAVLFFIGTGPVRGFAVTLGIGIITTLFTAFTMTRLIVAAWVRWARPKAIPI